MENVSDAQPYVIIQKVEPFKMCGKILLGLICHLDLHFILSITDCP